MRFRQILLAVLVGLVMVPTAMADTITPNTTTPVGPGFDLDATLPAGTPGFIAPCWFVGLAQQPLNGVANQTLDITNPLNIVLTSPPDPGRGANYAISWGTSNPPTPGAVTVYSLPTGMPNSDGNYFWTATVMSAGTTSLPVVTYDGTFHLDTGGAPITSWVISQPPDPDHPGAQTFEISFSLATVADPTLTISLNQVLDGANGPVGLFPEPVAEPATMGLLGAGLLALIALRLK